jgi:RHS repeat-associated protein
MNYKAKYVCFLAILLGGINLILSQCNVSVGNCVSKKVFGLVVYNYLYDSSDPSNYPAFNFPNPYLDLEGNSDDNAKIKVLSYLDYGDGITVFENLNSQYFFATAGIKRYEAIASLLEAWNIQPDYTGSVPFPDINSDNPYFGYINEANDLDLFDGVGWGNFNGDFAITTDELSEIIVRILLNADLHPISQNILEDRDNYFIPNDFEIENLGFMRSLPQGVLNHYAKNSFVIPDRKFSLNFSHYYSTQLVELPQSYFPLQPLSRGWTHTYNAYIIREDNVGVDEIDYYYIKWPEGTIDIFNQDDGEYVTLGVYDELDEDSNDKIIITKKNQTDYHFEQLDNNQEIYYLTKIEDRNSNEININYEESEVDDDLRRIETVESPSGKELEFEYVDNTDLLERIEDPLGRRIYFEYTGVSGSGYYQYPILVGFDDAKGQTTSYSYLNAGDEFGAYLLKRIELPKGNTISAEYDDDENGKLKKYTFNELEYEIDLKIDFNDENTPVTSTVEVTLPDGSTQDLDYEYNATGMLLAYEDNSNEVVITYPDNGPTILLPNEVTTNGLDVEYDYDNNGNITKIDIEDGKSEEFFSYNSRNELMVHQDPNGNVMQIERDSKGNLTKLIDPLGNETSYEYDSYGQLESVTNPEGITVDYEYENDGAVSSIDAPMNLSSSFTYDGINRMRTKTVNGQTSSYAYDDNDNITSFTNIGGIVTSYDYDANDNLEIITNGKGVETQFEYDDSDRVETETFGNLSKEFKYNDDGTLDRYTKTGGERIFYEYDDAGRLKESGTITDIEYDNNNRIESIETIITRLDLEYDELNRVDEVNDSFTATKVEYSYDAVGNITQIDYPDGIRVLYEYDEKNRLEDIDVIDRNTNVLYDIVRYQYRKDDKLRFISYGNGTLLSLRYDDAGRLESQYLIDDTTDERFFEQDLNYDERNNISSQSIRYKVDEEITSTTPDFETASYSYNDNNHIAGDFAVNNDGNLTSDSNNSYAYNIDDQIITRQKGNDFIEYGYNGYGHLVSKTVNGVNEKYVWDVLKENIIITGEGAAAKRHIYGLGLEATIDSNGNIQYYHGDHRGNVLMVTDTDRNIVKRYSYDDFGQTTVLSSNDSESPDQFTFMGKYGILNEDSEQGLYYVRARYYDASTGRFLTQDPVWSTNLYPYAGNNPISFVDPSGKIRLNSLSSLHETRYDSNYDAVNIGVSGTYVSPEGLAISEGFDFNYIIRGENSSLFPFLTHTRCAGAGFSSGFSANIGGYRDFLGDRDFEMNDIISDDDRRLELSLLISGLAITRGNNESGITIENTSILSPGEVSGSAFGCSTSLLFDFRNLNYVLEKYFFE